MAAYISDIFLGIEKTVRGISEGRAKCDFELEGPFEDGHRISDWGRSWLTADATHPFASDECVLGGIAAGIQVWLQMHAKYARIRISTMQMRDETQQYGTHN